MSCLEIVIPFSLYHNHIHLRFWYEITIILSRYFKKSLQIHFFSPVSSLYFSLSKISHPIRCCRLPEYLAWDFCITNRRLKTKRHDLHNSVFMTLLCSVFKMQILNTILIPKMKIPWDKNTYILVLHIH